MEYLIGQFKWEKMTSTLVAEASDLEFKPGINPPGQLTIKNPATGNHVVFNKVETMRQTTKYESEVVGWKYCSEGINVVIIND